MAELDEEVHRLTTDLSSVKRELASCGGSASGKSTSEIAAELSTSKRVARAAMLARWGAPDVAAVFSPGAAPKVEPREQVPEMTLGASLAEASGSEMSGEQRGAEEAGRLRAEEALASAGESEAGHLQDELY